jgi:hypothetical protein
MAQNRELDDLIDWCIDAGLEVTTTRRGHPRVQTDAGAVYGPKNPKDSRAVLNFRGLLRRKLREAGWEEDQLP